MPPLPPQLPTRDECLRLMRERQVMAHIIDHSLRVTEVALFLAQGLIQAGQPCDLPLLEAASLLHDIAKVESFQSKADHAVAGQALVAALGYPPALGHLIRHHVRLPESRSAPCQCECELLNYADKRVNGSIIVSLTERFDYIRGRYGVTAEIVARITELEDRTRELERRLFARLPFAPEELSCLLADGPPDPSRPVKNIPVESP